MEPVILSFLVTALPLLAGALLGYFVVGPGLYWLYKQVRKR